MQFTPLSDCMCSFLNSKVIIKEALESDQSHHECIHTEGCTNIFWHLHVNDFLHNVCVVM